MKHGKACTNGKVAIHVNAKPGNGLVTDWVWDMAENLKGWDGIDAYRIDGKTLSFRTQYPSGARRWKEFAPGFIEATSIK